MIWVLLTFKFVFVPRGLRDVEELPAKWKLADDLKVAVGIVVSGSGVVMLWMGGWECFLATCEGCGFCVELVLKGRLSDVELVGPDVFEREGSKAKCDGSSPQARERSGSSSFLLEAGKIAFICAWKETASSNREEWGFMLSSDVLNVVFMWNLTFVAFKILIRGANLRTRDDDFEPLI